ncbi:AraC family transcriptional regulator [Roseomonas sp. HJA6]|uniref:AraC family transcriptional regulator n=1 Tax=Roseomonas alba TaxID=2846776 RepID=A0ABS7AB06_9PROT|nr:AraC family transcriptional regulator [Neoroseomonas alba]MBW6399472.1 AraC family transcriptional regulator [Neoroseomonas alba]
MATALPLHRYPVFSTRSVKAARDTAMLFPSVEGYEAIGDPDRFHMATNSVLLDGIRLSAVQTTGHRVWPVDHGNATMLLAWDGLLGTTDKGRDFAVQGDDAALMRPGRRTTIIPGPYLGLVLQVPMARLAAHAGIGAADQAWRPDLYWPTQPSRRLSRTLRLIVQELDAEEALAPTSRVARGMVRLLMDLLLDDCLAVAKVAAQPVSVAGLAQVHRAEAALRARFEDAISIADLAGELGVSMRALQAGFRRYRGTTPRDFLAICRLDAARDRLMNARPSETVASIAYECGAMHLGRFAASYRARFGETPSATLASARRKG